MPGSYLIDVAHGLVFSRGWGVVTDDELLWHAKTLRADPRFHPGFRQVVSFLDLTEARVSADGVRGVAHINPFRTDSRRAFVVPSDLAFGLARMFEAHTNSDQEQFRIFRLLGPAFEWVGLDPAAPWPAREPDAISGVTITK
jgi:hypothetical protein